MNPSVQHIAEQVKALPAQELEELLDWLAEYGADRAGDWDRTIEADSQPGGRLSKLLDRARADITTGRTKPLDEVLDDL